MSTHSDAGATPTAPARSGARTTAASKQARVSPRSLPVKVTVTRDSPSPRIAGNSSRVGVTVGNDGGNEVVRSALAEIGPTRMPLGAVTPRAVASRWTDDGGWLVDVTVPASDVPPSVHLDATARSRRPASHR